MNNKKFKTLLLVLAVILYQGIVCCTAVAEDLETVVLSHSVNVSFSPEEAFLMVELDGAIKKVKGILVPPFSKDEQDQKRGSWWVGAALTVSKYHEPLNYSIVLKGKEHAMSVVLNLVGGGKENLLEAVPALKSALSAKQEQYKSWDVQIAAQELSLKRQRADADVIANVSRIVDIFDEIEASHYESENLDKDIAALHEAFKQAKNPKAPKNFTRRELELTKQSTELSQISKNLEAGESGRKVALQGDLQRKLAIVEATRYENEEQLIAELASLKARAAGGGGANNHGQNGGNGQGHDYWESQ